MNTWAWIAWLVTCLSLISAGRNPLYLILVWLALQLVFAVWSDTGADNLFLLSPLRLSLFMVFTAALFNALTSHFGATVLLTIPGKIPLISGPITLEALIYGAINGLVLGSILTAFMVINLALPTHTLVRLIPRTYYALAIIISIAVAFLPSTRRQLQLVREAQAIRGRRVAGIRDYVALFMPVLVGGLEHAVQLAETMTARGFAAAQDVGDTRRHRLAMLVGLAAVLAGWFLQWNASWRTFGAILLPLGCLVVAAALWMVGRQAPRSSYKSEPWGWLDGLAMLVAMIGILTAFQLLPGLDYATLSYSPYPAISLPSFNPALGVIMVSVVYPVLATPPGESRAETA